MRLQVVVDGVLVPREPLTCGLVEVWGREGDPCPHVALFVELADDALDEI
jgi:hypothetical protein